MSDHICDFDPQELERAVCHGGMVECKSCHNNRWYSSFKISPRGTDLCSSCREREESEKGPWIPGDEDLPALRANIDAALRDLDV